MAKDPLAGETVPTKEMAEKLSAMLGCSGAHKVGDDAWGPCESDRDLQKLIEVGNPAFREWKAKQKKKKSILDFMSLKSKSKKGFFNTREEAEMSAAKIGCEGAHQVKQGVWAPCGTPEERNAAQSNAGAGRSRILRAQRPARRVVTNRRVWENLRGRGPRGIEALPGGGLVSGKNDEYTTSKGTQRKFSNLDQKRFYTRKRRTEYAKRGWALPDGSYPIRNVGDLNNAIQAYGLGKDKEKTKKHIIKRARALGKLDLIPKSWKKRAKTSKTSTS
tara:strand:- start:8946 stop:9770 length:825 start_codon:yes stop_codon:yes gene_type:complete